MKTLRLFIKKDKSKSINLFKARSKSAIVERALLKFILLFLGFCSSVYC